MRGLTVLGVVLDHIEWMRDEIKAGRLDRLAECDLRTPARGPCKTMTGRTAWRCKNIYWARGIEAENGSFTPAGGETEHWCKVSLDVASVLAIRKYERSPKWRK